MLRLGALVKYLKKQQKYVGVNRQNWTPKFSNLSKQGVKLDLQNVQYFDPPPPPQKKIILPKMSTKNYSIL